MQFLLDHRLIKLRRWKCVLENGARNNTKPEYAGSDSVAVGSVGFSSSLANKFTASDISRADKTCKKLKLVRKVYSLPTHYDVATVSSASDDRDILIEVLKREQSRVGARRIRPQIKRHNTDFQ